MEKTIACPADARLHERARAQLAVLGQKAGVELRHAHTKQFRRMRKALKTLTGYTGRVMRDLRRHLGDMSAGSLRERVLDKRALVSQRLASSAQGRRQDLCPARGRLHLQGQGAGAIGIRLQGQHRHHAGRGFRGRHPQFCGQSLRWPHPQPGAERVEILTDHCPDLAAVDRGYRGHGEEKTRVLISGTRRGLTPKLIADLRRRSAIEAEIGRMKTDGRLARCSLKGTATLLLRYRSRGACGFESGTWRSAAMNRASLDSPAPMERRRVAGSSCSKPAPSICCTSCTDSTTLLIVMAP